MKKKDQNESEDHHFVPQTYLKNFPTQADSKKVCVANKHQEDRVFNALPRNICFKKNLYRLEGKTLEERQAIERFYSTQIEKDYSKIYKLLVNPKKIEITNQERQAIIMTIVSLYLRNTIWLSNMNAVYDSAIAEAYQMMLESGSHTIDSPFGTINCTGRTINEVQKEVAEYNRQKFATEHLLYVYSLVDSRLEDGIHLVKLEEGREFITSDNPVIILSRDYQVVPFDTENIISLPIDPKHKLLIMPKSWGADKNRIDRWTATKNIGFIQEMINNGKQYENAHNLIIGSQSGIENFKELKPKYFEVSNFEQLEQDKKSYNKILTLMKKIGINTSWFRGDIFPK